MCVAGKDTKKRWKSIRDHYKRQRKEAAIEFSARKFRANYWDKLGFLDAADDEKDTIASVPVERTLVYDTNNTKQDTRAIAGQLLVFQSEATPTTTRPIFHPILPKRSEELTKKPQEKKKDDTPLKKPPEKSVPTDDDIDMFFKGVAMTVKKFRPELIIETKRKVFKTVMNMEMLNLQTETGTEITKVNCGKKRPSSQLSSSSSSS